MTELRRFIISVPPFRHTDTINRVADVFLKPMYKYCLSVAVVDAEGKPLGTISRYRLNEIFLKKYGRDLFGNRPVSDFMNNDFLQVSIHSSLAEAAVAITGNMRFPLSEDFVVIEHGFYAGMGAVLHVLEALERELQHKTRELQRLNLDLQQLSMLDGLTGIANRRHFDEHLASEWQKAFASGWPLALLLLDVDNFKSYNDLYGHIQGDACLKKVAQSVSRAVHRPDDLAARYGGEEFGIILPKTDIVGAVHVAERILLMVRHLNLLHGKAVHGQRVSVSIGAAAAISGSGLTSQLLLQEADRMLYLAKQNGKDRVESELPVPLLISCV